MATAKLEQWRGHLAAAREQGLPLSHYAREHGLSPHALYAAQKKLRRESRELLKQRVSPTRVAPKPSPFVAVQVAESMPAALRARLPNGVELEFGERDVIAATMLVRMLAALPCSG